MASTEIPTYKDALFHVKRSFIIIGLTGFTGSGCTTARKLLGSKQRPAIPNQQGGASTSSERDRLIDRKLLHAWKALPWTPFCAIEVSKVIFALACLRVLRNGPDNDPVLSEIAKAVSSHSTELQGLGFLSDDVEFDDSKNAEDLLNAFSIAGSLYLPFKRELDYDLSRFITLMQDWGDNLRRFGTVLPATTVPEPKHLFVIPAAVLRLIKAHRSFNNSTHFVIDAFRNPFEVEYFKRRYSEFYLVGITRSDLGRRQSLHNLSPTAITSLDHRERGGNHSLSADGIGKWMTTQNIDECLRKADVYVNNREDSSATFPDLRHALVKLISLAKMPGCIPPTDDERCIQLAMCGRQMSGCISRRVGATVVSKSGYVIGLGWNDPPSGQVPCALRTIGDLVNGGSSGMFSKYEQSAEFVQHIQNSPDRDVSFCFRTEYGSIKGQKQAEYTRALHAEENAIFQAMRNAPGDIAGGTLYTTASTCTLCAKKAYEVGIDRIVFIEQYPGIANEQSLLTGSRQIRIDQFDGITGSAYYWLYESLYPEKEIIQICR